MASRNTNPLQDTSAMPFGKHKGTEMQNVPADYMFYLWTELGLESDVFSPVARYIRENIAAFEKEHPDGIWRK